MIITKVKQFVNITNLFSGLLLVCVLAIDNFSLQENVYYAFFISYIMEFFLDKKWKTVAINKKTSYFFLLFLFFALALIYYPFDQPQPYFKLIIERRYPLLGFAFVGVFGLNPLYRLRYFISSVVVASVSIVIYLIFFRVGISQFFVDPNLFNLARSQYVNSHMIVNFYFNSSIIGIWYLLSTYWSRMYKLYRPLLIFSLFLVLYSLSISEGRSGFLFGLLISAFLTFSELWNKKKKYGILVAIFIPWVAVMLISTHKRMEYDFIKSEPRIHLWEAGVSVIKEKPILGYGISSAQLHFDAAREIFQTSEYKVAWQHAKHLDSHNQYLQTWMEFGIVGILLLLIVYLSPYFLVIRRRKKLTLVFTFLVLFQSFFDMFATGFFSAIFCLWLVFLIRTGSDKKELDEEKKFWTKKIDR
jgi:O-antigen ligase